MRILLSHSLVVSLAALTLSCNRGSRALQAAGCSRSAPEGAAEAAPKEKGGSASAARSPEPAANVGLTREVSAHLRAVAKSAPRNDAVFMKVGDSITSGGGAYGSFGCLSRLEQKSGHAKIDLAGRDALRATIDYFDRVEIPAHKPGRSRDHVVGSRFHLGTRLARLGVAAEERRRRPRPAGERALGDERAVRRHHDRDQRHRRVAAPVRARALGLRQYAKNFLDMVRELEKRGVIPILTYVPPVNSVNEPYRKWFTAAYVAVCAASPRPRRSRPSTFTRRCLRSAIRATAPAIRCTPISSPSRLASSPPRGSASGTIAQPALPGSARQGAAGGDCPRGRRRPLATAAREGGTAEAQWSFPHCPLQQASIPKRGAPVRSPTTRAAAGSGASGSERVFQMTVTEGTPVRAIVVPPTGECDSKQGAFTKCDESRDVNVSLFKGSLDMPHCVRSHST